jgi:hypothetical protein
MVAATNSVEHGRLSGSSNVTMRVWISSYKNAGVLKLCVQSWLRFTDFPITVLDDLSTPECRDATLSLVGERVQVIGPENRLGHAATMQQARHAAEDYILLSDSDVEVPEPICEDMFPDADLSGVFVDYFVDTAIGGCYTLPRFYTSFPRCKRSHLNSIRMDQRFLVVADVGIRYDTGSVLHWTLKRAGIAVAEISGDLERELVDARPLKDGFNNLWAKHTRFRQINVIAWPEHHRAKRAKLD